MTRFNKRVNRFEIMGFFSDNTWEGRIGDEGPIFVSHDESSTVVPSGSLVMPVRDNLWFGFTILGSGFSDDYEDGWPGRYFIEEYSLLSISAFPSLATKLTEKLSVAAGLALTYTSYEQEKAVMNLDPGFGDGTLNIDTDGFSAGFALSALYEVSDTTRFGFSYRSEIDPELDGRASFSGLGPVTEGLLDAAGLLDARIDVASTQPQSAIVGMYHEFEDASAVTLDAVWSDYSNFELAEIYVNGDSLSENDVEYDDIFALSAIYSRPIADRWRIGFGAMYAGDMIDDDKRTLTLRFDSLWSLGVGFQWQWEEDRWISATLNYMELGDAPVSSLQIPGIGAVTGHFTDRGTIYLRVALSLGGKN